MKNNYIVILALAIFSLGLIATSCKEKEKTTAEVKITCVPLTGQTVDCNGLTVEIHKNSKFTNLYAKATTKGSATSASCSFADVPAGTYYVVAWKDRDNSGDFSTNDFFGFYDAALVVVGGENNAKTIKMYVVNP